MSVYKMRNPSNNKECETNSMVILKIIKKLDGRNEGVQKLVIKIWEDLEGRKFTKKELEHIDL